MTTLKITENNLLTIHDVCEFTTLSKATIYREIKKGNLPKPVKITEGRVAWLRSDLLSSQFYQLLLQAHT